MAITAFHIDKTKLLATAAGLAAWLLSGTAVAEGYESMARCMLQQMEAATDSTTVGALRDRCEEKTEEPISVVEEAERQTAVQRRQAAIADVVDRPFSLTVHKPNYVLPITYNDNPNTDVFAFLPAEDPLDNEEIKFQFSFKFPLVRGLFKGRSDLLAAYTHQSWWQAYNSLSAPFRETNYEPEVFFRHYGGPKNIAGWDVGFVHQSNGRAEPLSRSWDRIFARAVFDAGDLAFSAKAWWRIPEDDDDDDNPNEYRYLGYGEFQAAYAPNKNTFSLMVRPGTEEIGAELTWSYPITYLLRVYALWYYGYGESLLDYDHRTNRIGVGIALNDWLQH